MTRLLPLFALALVGCPKRAPSAQPTPSLIAATGIHMGTEVQVSVWTADPPAAERQILAVFAEFTRIEDKMSDWRPDTPLSAVNAGAGVAPVPVDGELFDLIARALELSALTDGAFDPTFAAMWGLWTFGDDGVDSLPDPMEVSDRLDRVDWTRVQLDPVAHTVFLPQAGMRLGLGAIAKGYATDRSVALLRKAGFSDFAVQAGGELYVSGTKGGTPWRVGIQDPRGDDAFAAIELTDGAFDTSGDYERFFEVDGVRYCHILDPQTGWPATRSRSATVLAADATTADALSTAFFVLGPERALAVAEGLEGIETVVVGADSTVAVSSGLSERLWVAHPPTP